VAEERADPRDPESAASRLEEWRQAERASSAQDQESILERIARKAADAARELFHLREGEARDDEVERRAVHPGEPPDRR
jgi:hypothetical protein